MLSTRWEMTLVAPVSFYLARKTILVTSGEFLAELWSLNLFNEEIAEMLQATRPVLYAALERAKEIVLCCSQLLAWSIYVRIYAEYYLLDCDDGHLEAENLKQSFSEWRVKGWWCKF